MNYSLIYSALPRAATAIYLLQTHTICASALTDGVKLRHFNNMCALLMPQRGENRSGFPSRHDFFFRQHERKSVNFFARQGRKQRSAYALRRCLPQTHGKKFCQIKTFCVNTILCASENRAFRGAHPICASALTERVNAARVVAVCPYTARRRGKNRSGFPSNHGKKFCQLKTFCVNPFVNKPFLKSQNHQVKSQ